MPKQKGTHRILGTTGDMTYQKTKDGYSAREKTHVNVERMKTSEKYARTRENMSEFGRAGKATKLLRTAFANLVKEGSDTRSFARLNEVVLRVIKTDTVNDRGLRVIHNGDLLQLQGFDFNGGSLLASAFTAPYAVTVDRDNGQCNIEIAPFIPKLAVVAPPGATHIRMVAGTAVMDFENSSFASDIQKGAAIILDRNATNAITLPLQVTADTALPVFVVLGMQYLLIENGKEYTLSKDYNPLAIVKVDLDA